MSIRDELTDIFAKHLPEHRSVERMVGNCSCICGWEGWGDTDDEKTAKFAAHLTDTILARCGVVRLPDPVPADGDIDEDDDPYEFRGPWANYFVVDGKVESDVAVLIAAPDQARAEAAAIIAAANRAEERTRQHQVTE